MSEGENTVPKTETKYPWSNYTLKLGRGEPVSTTQYVLYAVQIAAVIILSYLSVACYSTKLFRHLTILFRVPILLSVHHVVGNLGHAWSIRWMRTRRRLNCWHRPVPSIAYSISDFVPPLFAFVIYRGVLSKRGYDPLWRDLTDKEVAGVKTKRVGAWFWFILINGVILNVISAELGIGILYKLGSGSQRCILAILGRMVRRRLASNGHHHSSARQRTHKSRRKTRTNQPRLGNLRATLL